MYCRDLTRKTTASLPEHFPPHTAYIFIAKDLHLVMISKKTIITSVILQKIFEKFIQGSFISDETQSPIIPMTSLYHLPSKDIACSFLTSSIIILAIFHAISSLVCEIKQRKKAMY